MSFSRILVFGAGAVGSIIGALLSEKNDVILIGSKAHMDAVNSRGLSVSGDINEVFHVKAETQIQDIPSKTLIFLTTKAYDTEAAAKHLVGLVRNDTSVLVLQNGLGSESLVKRIIGSKANVLRGITSLASEFFQPGEIRYWKGETVIEKGIAAEDIAEIMNSCGLKTNISENINEQIWRKTLVNCMINPLTAIFRIKNNRVITATLAPIRNQIALECKRVAQAEGIPLSVGLEKNMEREILMYTNYSSMCQDIMNGKKTEIDFLNGKIVELGAKHSIPTPVNETLFHLIKFMEEENGISRTD